MNNREKEVLRHILEQEKEIIAELKKLYQIALDDIGERIKALMADELTQSRIYRIEYQKALKGQISAILENLNSRQYDSIQEYLKGCYEDGFIGTLYSLKDYGIPIIIPINQEEVVKALMLDSRISEGMYTKLGHNVSELKKSISSEISRGISTAMPYADIARNLKNRAGVTINQSMRIVRTEGNRIHNQSTYDAALRIKKWGADIVKVWDATLDSKTRPHHRQLDGQVREIEEYFEINGKKALYPLSFGVAAEDVNCRCVCLVKPRWDLEGPFTKRDNENDELLEFQDVKSYEEFKKKYWQTVDKDGESGIIKEEEMLPRKMKNGSNAVDWTVIQSDEYSRKFTKLSSDERVSSAIETRAKWALSNRDGKATEELYAVSLKNGSEIARITKQNYAAAVKRTKKFTKKLNKADMDGDNILLLHNHPRGLPPSISDINALFGNKNVSGITVGHNGSVYYYTKPKTIVPEDDWNIAMRHFKQFSEVTSAEKSLELLGKKYGFTITKL